MNNQLPNRISEPELILQLRQKNKNALAYLYQHYASSLYCVINRIVKPQEVAEEVLQDSFIKVWDNMHRYDPEKGKLFTWMLNIARNLAIDTLRSKEFTRKNKTDQLENNVLLVMCDTWEEPNIRDTALIDLLCQLGTKQQTVIHLIYFQGYTHRQVSEEFGIPLGTVKTRVRLALVKLRDLLNTA